MMSAFYGLSGCQAPGWRKPPSGSSRSRDEGQPVRPRDGHEGFGWRQAPNLRVDGEDRERIAVAVGGDEPSAGRVEGEVARRSPAGADVLLEHERAVAGVDAKDGHAVVAAIGGVDHTSVRVDQHFGGGVLDWD